MKLSAPLPSPFGARFALTMSAMLLMASFELALCGHSTLKKVQNAILRCFSSLSFKSPSCGDVCANCGQHKNIADSTLLIVLANGVHYNINFATAIGKRLALSSDKTRWDGINFVQSVFLPNEAGNFEVNDKKKYCGVDSVTYFSKVDTHHIAFVKLDKNLPSSIVPACLPQSNLIDSVVSTKFNVPLYTIEWEPKNTKLKLAGVHPFSVTFSQKMLTVVGENKEDYLVQLEKHSDPINHIVHGVAVMHRVGKLDFVYGILQGEGDDFSILPIHKYLKSIEEEAGKKCICKKTEAATF